MRRFEVIITDQTGQRHHISKKECLTFAEAARYAYATKHTLGLDWKIVSVHQINEKEEE